MLHTLLYQYLVIPVTMAPIYSSSAPSFTYDNNTIFFLCYNPVHRHIFELKYSAAMAFSPCWRNCESQYYFQYSKLESRLRNQPEHVLRKMTFLHRYCRIRFLRASSRRSKSQAIFARFVNLEPSLSKCQKKPLF